MGSPNHYNSGAPLILQLVKAVLAVAAIPVELPDGAEPVVNVGHQNGVFPQLADLGLDYIKMHPSYIRGIASNEGIRNFSRACARWRTPSASPCWRWAWRAKPTCRCWLRSALTGRRGRGLAKLRDSHLLRHQFPPGNPPRRGGGTSSQYEPMRFYHGCARRQSEHINHLAG